ncbi:MAG TPA: hypothetical protein VIQ00_06050 [Chitinophagaceae bacterium]
MQKQFFIFFLLLLTGVGYSQQRFSLATDFSLLRNFKSSQKFWAVGQTVQADFHFTPVNTLYVFVSYYSPGKFNNLLTATAKQLTTQPNEINFTNQSQVNFKTFSVGWKRFLKGSAYAESSWNLYGYAGFGLLLAKAQNTFSVMPDTSNYILPEHPINGDGRFQRLTIDAAVGGEYPIGGDLYLYLEGRTWILTSDYPTKYLQANQNSPVVITANFGLRILF